MSFWLHHSLSHWATRLIVGFILIVLAAACWIFSTSTFDQPQPKAGIVLLGGIHEEGWNAPQYRGIRKACNAMGIKQGLLRIGYRGVELIGIGVAGLQRIVVRLDKHVAAFVAGP